MKSSSHHFLSSLTILILIAITELTVGEKLRCCKTQQNNNNNKNNNETSLPTETCQLDDSNCFIYSSSTGDGQTRKGCMHARPCVTGAKDDPALKCCSTDYCNCFGNSVVNTASVPSKFEFWLVLFTIVHLNF